MKEEHQEVRRRHGPTLVEKLRWHVGTIVAALLGILLLLQIFGVVLGPPADARTALRDLGAATAKVTEAVGARAFPVDEKMKAVDEQVGQLRTTFKHLSSAVDAPAGVTYPPDYLRTLKPGESNEIRFLAPIDLVATPEAGGVDLKWAEPPNNNVKVGKFEIFRKEGADAPALLQSVDGATHAFRDANAKPGHAYEYTVQSVADDPAIANTPRGRSPASGPATAKAVADFKIELVDHKDDVVTIKVSKWHQGSWRDRTFEVREGEKIGSLDQALGIDFSTGRQLAKVTVETSEVPVSKDELVFDNKGRVVLDQGAPKRVPVAGVEIRRKTTVSVTGGALPDEDLVLEKS